MRTILGAMALCCAVAGCDGGERVEAEVLPAAGLYANSSFAADTSATPMIAAPALVDGDLDSSAGVSIGPDGASFHNLALDLGSARAVERLRIHVRDASGAGVASRGDVTWSVWSSSDGSHWTAVDVGREWFVAPASAYDLELAPTSTRFVKAVSFGTSIFETLVTELQAFEAR